MRHRVLVAVALLASIGGSAAFLVAYGAAGTQAQGATLAFALGGLGLALTWWSRWLMPRAPHVEERHDAENGSSARRPLTGVVPHIGRRRVLTRLLLVAAGAVGVAVVSPLRSLGPAPGKALRRTAWRAGTRLVGVDGRRVRPEALPIDGVLTVFPEGATEDIDSQAILVRLGPAEQSVLGRSASVADGHVAFSKICTHAGCPVGLYQEDSHLLVCPCHQAAFNVLDGARPVFGPAPRPLPRLPLAIDDEGFLVARGGFDAPVGPGRWELR